MLPEEKWRIYLLDHENAFKESANNADANLKSSHRGSRVAAGDFVLGNANTNASAR